MRLSKKTEYALRALFAIARASDGPSPGSWRIEQVSRQENIPVKFLEQILLSLRHAGLLTSKRGVGGGYRLARPASEIAVGDVIRALDGPLTPLPCASPEARRERCTCPDERTCPVRILMTEVKPSWKQSLMAAPSPMCWRCFPVQRRSVSRSRARRKGGSRAHPVLSS